jgi:hypothetical protein
MLRVVKAVASEQLCYRGVAKRLLFVTAKPAQRTILLK